MPDQLNIIIGDPDFAAASELRRVCSSIAGVHVKGVAHSSQTLTAKVNHGKPDLVLLAPTVEMGGEDAVDELKKSDPDLNIIVLYDPQSCESDEVIHALEQGAYECMERPVPTDERWYNTFRLRLLTITGLLRSRKRFSKKPHPHPRYKSKFFMPPQRPERTVLQKPGPGMKADVVVIASSTGGPEILSRIFSILPGNLKVPILLVQHIPEKITRHFAKSLNEKSELDIRQAVHGEVIQPSTVYIAPGGQHMKVTVADAKGDRHISLSSGKPINSVRPSADLMFESVARSYSGNILAIILTGMGEDGKKGVTAMKEKGCYCITQSAETCVVYGMPRTVHEAGLSDEQLDPLSITQKIVMMTQ
jgi:two-component system chemotaxis response regulator CheB